ncbi:hypothetical protein [Peribacillus sp. TH27]|uniref:hypothetical protein n=1 Tax=Peribacillus sp. TH27 TaxID=2798484 RepID=UPI00191128AF|nr:hypothetical protein [Peribacillus sp. TH27]MBK5463559.1 hypothetical protein [Peribacillus sp. TH27]MBK5463572.1 hypothetical protein [Peribacillus sp. TH27]
MDKGVVTAYAPYGPIGAHSLRIPLHSTRTMQDATHYHNRMSELGVASGKCVFTTISILIQVIWTL